MLVKAKHFHLEKNKFSGEIPSKLFSSKMVLKHLYLSNNKLTGPIPDLTSMNNLQYVDMSNNNFTESDFPPWISSLESLTTFSLRVIGF
ncbi:hypothetical protein ACB098_11G000500 [Castanea mollissima]